MSHEDGKMGLVERKDGKKRAWIPLVRPTYQVISVLLHCLTAEKPHKTKEGKGGADTTQRDYCSSGQTEMNRGEKGSQVTRLRYTKRLTY